jgi:nucleoside phosphorylase
MEARDVKRRVDFGIITVREDEFAAVLRRFGQQDLLKLRRSYVITQTATKTGVSYLVGLVRCADQGTAEAQSAATDMISDLDPQWLVLVGIAGGVPHDDFTLGDVVVATRLLYYSTEAALPGGESEFSIAGGPMHGEVRSVLASLRALEERELRGWNSESSIGMARPRMSFDHSDVDGDSEWQLKVERSLGMHCSADGKGRAPRVTAGPMASSDRLVRDSSLLRKWLRTARHIYAIEMELAGVYQAARRRKHERPVLAIRGISDIVGLRRDAKWTQYACETAAAFTYAFVKAGIIEPRGTRFESHSRRLPAIRLEIAAITSLVLGMWLASAITPVTASYDVVTLYAVPSVAAVGLILSPLAQYSLVLFTKVPPKAYCVWVVGIAVVFLLLTWVLVRLALLVN